jgi:hypothetical protein
LHTASSVGADAPAFERSGSQVSSRCSEAGCFRRTDAPVPALVLRTFDAGKRSSDLL